MKAQMNPSGLHVLPKAACWTALAAVILFVLWSALPEIAWGGVVWLTIDLRVTDAATARPVTDATVTLLPDPPPQRFSSPTVLTTRTDGDGRATLKHKFGAGGGSHSTGIVVRSSLVRCEAPDYIPSEVRVAQADELRFWDFPFLAPRNHSTTLSVTLSH